MTRLSMRDFLAILAAGGLFLGAGCGGGDDDGAAGDGGGEPGSCGFESDDYLPYQPGFRWTYQITDLVSGERETKEQHLEPEMEDPEFGTVLTQITGKLNGTTVSLVRKEGDRVLRFTQEDRDAADALEQTTTYEPAQIRIDESAERTMEGAEWDEEYTETIDDPVNGTTVIPTVDHWTVLGVDEPCDAAEGSGLGTFSCIRLRRTRTMGGIAEKEFHFARGVGKVKEIGANQLEELSGCAAE
jgi:hypothetical protein